MKGKFATWVIIAVMVCNVQFTYAEDTVVDKLDQLKETIHSYFQGAPKPGFRQKVQIVRIARAHRATLRKDFMELRRTIISMKREFRQQLTREQLLTLLHEKDELSMLPPGLKAAKALKELEKEDRIQLVKLIRRVWHGEKAEIAQNVRNLRSFVQNNIHPYIFRKLSLTAEQKAEWMRIVAENDEVLEKLCIRIVFKLSHLRDEIHGVLSAEQLSFLEANRDKVFQEILNFLDEL